MADKLFELITLFVSGGTLTAVFAYFKGRKARRLEYKIEEDNYRARVLDSQQRQEARIEDLMKRIDVQRDTVLALQDKLQDARVEIVTLTNQNEVLTAQNMRLLDNQKNMEARLCEMDSTIAALSEQLKAAGIEPAVKKRRAGL